MANTEELIAYYNKFNEDKRLNSRHGQTEYVTSMKYLNEYLEKLMQKKGYTDKSQLSILDVGAGTGRYAVSLAKEGYAVTAVEPVKHNLMRLKKKSDKICGICGNALNLKKLADESFDLVIGFGPLYHLEAWEDKAKALSEMKRVLKPDGYLFVTYIMNEYAVLIYAIREKHILEAMQSGALDEEFHCRGNADALYSFTRIEDMDKLNETLGLTLEKRFTSDGPANHMRRDLNALSQEEFEAFLQYQLCTCERKELLGASGHVVDILTK